MNYTLVEFVKKSALISTGNCFGTCCRSETKSADDSTSKKNGCYQERPPGCLRETAGQRVDNGCGLIAKAALVPLSAELPDRSTGGLTCSVRYHVRLRAGESGVAEGFGKSDRQGDRKRRSSECGAERGTDLTHGALRGGPLA